MRRRLITEVVLILAVTFGTSGIRAALRLVDSLLTAPLNEQSTTLIDATSTTTWLDLALQATSAITLVGWGGLAWYLLGVSWCWPSFKDLARGAGFAALIGLPGLALYVTGVHLGLSKVVVPATEAVQLPTSLLWAFANGFGEEVVVVMYLLIRLRQLGCTPWPAIAASSVLRGSYHLYQGVSAGVGNLAMGLVFAYYFQRGLGKDEKYQVQRVWPLIIAHFLIDAVAYIAYPLVDLSFLGI